MSKGQEPSISKTPAWQALVAHQRRMADIHMRKLFDEDPARAAVSLLGVLISKSSPRLRSMRQEGREPQALVADEGDRGPGTHTRGLWTHRFKKDVELARQDAG